MVLCAQNQQHLDCHEIKHILEHVSSILANDVAGLAGKGLAAMKRKGTTVRLRKRTCLWTSMALST